MPFEIDVFKGFGQLADLTMIFLWTQIDLQCKFTQIAVKTDIIDPN